MSTATEPPIRVFLSYAQVDDVVLEFIDSFTTSLRHMALADQGRNLDIFIDRDSIDWGENWQAAIRSGIDGAMIFMPVVTRQYFERPACREELLTFYNEAKSLGVTSLLLPVVLLGHSYISEDSQDVAARIISERQWRDLKDAWLAGPQSATWRSTIVQLAAELVGAAASAERALTVAPVPADPPATAADDAPGAAEVSEALEQFGEDSQRLIASLGDPLVRMTELMSDPDRVRERPAGEVRQVLSEMAAQLQPVGADFQEAGREFESLALKTDGIMRAYVRYLRENQLQEILESERASLQESEEALKPVVEAEAFIAEFLDQLRSLEVSSAPMRNALRGFREGSNALRSGIAIMQSWPRMIDDN